MFLSHTEFLAVEKKACMWIYFTFVVVIVSIFKFRAFFLVFLPKN